MDRPVPPPPAELVPARPSADDVAKETVTVILVAPELFDGSAQAIADALRTAPVGARALFRIERDEHLALADAVASFGLPSQWLLGSDVAIFSAPILFARMPDGSDANAANEVALALSDVLIVPSPESDAVTAIVRLARAWKKLEIVSGDPIPPVSPPSDAGGDLDPGRCRNRMLWALASRLDPFSLECFASRLRDDPPGSHAMTRKNLSKCFRRREGPIAYFAPGDWRDRVPDRDAVSACAPIVAAFDVFDRRALFGAALHRDAIWFLHLSAAFAVVIAVLGVIQQMSSSGSSENEAAFSVLPIAELLLLGTVVGCVWWLRRSRLQENWQTCRFVAEHLRVARMCLPLMVMPKALCGSDASATTASRDGMAAQAAIDVLRRTVRNQGLPRRSAKRARSEALAWLKMIVNDQKKYHEGNWIKLEKAESGMVATAAAIFILAIYSVVVHILSHVLHDSLWLPILSAIGPASVAAYPISRADFASEYRLTVWLSLTLVLLPLFSPVLFIIFGLFPGEATWSLVFTAGGPALAAALHGIGTRLGIVHRAALSKDAAALLAEIEDKIDGLGQETIPSARSWQVVHDLAMEAAAAMSSENASWHTLVRREHDNLPT